MVGRVDICKAEFTSQVLQVSGNFIESRHRDIRHKSIYSLLASPALGRRISGEKDCE